MHPKVCTEPARFFGNRFARVTLTAVAPEHPARRMRVAVVAALRDCSLKPAGLSSPNLANVLMKELDVDAFIDSHLRPLLGSSCSFEECARKTGLCRAAIAEAVRAGHPVQTYVRGYKRTTTASLERFQSAYLPLAAVAQEKRRSPRLLVRLIRKKRLPVIFVARANHASPHKGSSPARAYRN